MVCDNMLNACTSHWKCIDVYVLETIYEQD